LREKEVTEEKAEKPANGSKGNDTKEGDKNDVKLSIEVIPSGPSPNLTEPESPNKEAEQKLQFTNQTVAGEMSIEAYKKAEEEAAAKAAAEKKNKKDKKPSGEDAAAPDKVPPKKKEPVKEEKPESLV
jgi:hypothetical protein